MGDLVCEARSQPWSRRVLGGDPSSAQGAKNNNDTSRYPAPRLPRHQLRLQPHTVRGRDDCPHYGRTRPPFIVIAGVGGPLESTSVSPCTGLVVLSKPPSFHRAFGIIAGFAALPRLLAVSGCCLRTTGFWKMTSRNNVSAFSALTVLTVDTCSSVHIFLT